jgi:HEAT repeat protein
MHSTLRAATLVALLSVSFAAPARPRLAELSDRLNTSGDFRVRVQAVLELGASKDGAALPLLEHALDDDNSSVRVAAAAALGKLGDTRGIRALDGHLSDSSEAVRSQVKSSLGRLRAKAEDPSRRIVVRLANVRNGTRVKSTAIEREILLESRKKLDQMPGVHVLSPSADGAAQETNQPAVMVTPNIQKLAAAREGDSIVYSASIEYILHAMPDEAIMGRVSGTASAAATEEEAKDRAGIAVLRQEVVAAAVNSALSRAENAIQAAARL